MSRSFKKHPMYCDRNPYMKNQANRKIRRNKKEAFNNSSFKKVFESWEIKDYYFRGMTKTEIRRKWKNDPDSFYRCKTLKDAIRKERRGFGK